jgi:hypothetical protein
VSLFPDQYPDEPRPPARVIECCETWMEFVDERDGDVAPVWRLAHALAHGRVPFTLDALASAGGVDVDEVRVVVKAAAERGWVKRGANEVRGDTTVLWVGALRRR